MFGKDSPPKEIPVADHSTGVGDIVANGSDAESGEYDELGVRCPPHTTEKRLKARIDYHILPFIIILYLLAFLDRVNVVEYEALLTSLETKETKTYN